MDSSKLRLVFLVSGAALLICSVIIASILWFNPVADLESASIKYLPDVWPSDTSHHQVLKDSYSQEVVLGQSKETLLVGGAFTVGAIILVILAVIIFNIVGQQTQPLEDPLEDEMNTGPESLVDTDESESDTKPWISTFTLCIVFGTICIAICAVIAVIRYKKTSDEPAESDDDDGALNTKPDDDGESALKQIKEMLHKKDLLQLQNWKNPILQSILQEFRRGMAPHLQLSHILSYLANHRAQYEPLFNKKLVNRFTAVYPVDFWQLANNFNTYDEHSIVPTAVQRDLVNAFYDEAFDGEYRLVFMSRALDYYLYTALRLVARSRHKKAKSTMRAVEKLHAELVPLLSVA